MKAIDFLIPGEKALVVFTDGLNLTIRPDGTGTSGNWIVNPHRRADKIIIDPVAYSTETRITNEIFMGQQNGIIGPTPDDDRRYISWHFIDLKHVGTTDMNWKEFAETGSAPVKYLKK